jgi:hypothetical protein
MNLPAGWAQLSTGVPREASREIFFRGKRCFPAPKNSGRFFENVVYRLLVWFWTFATLILFPAFGLAQRTRVVSVSRKLSRSRWPF